MEKDFGESFDLLQKIFITNGFWITMKVLGRQYHEKPNYMTLTALYLNFKLHNGCDKTFTRIKPKLLKYKLIEISKIRILNRDRVCIKLTEKGFNLYVYLCTIVKEFFLREFGGLYLYV